MEFHISGLVLILNILSGCTKDVAPNIYCNPKKLTWRVAWEDCMNAQGKPVSYDTGIGLTIRGIHLHSEADVWTFDYALLSSTLLTHKRLCGFNYLTQTSLFPPIMYGDCDVKRYYLCKNNTENRLEVHNSKRDEVKCPGIISEDDLLKLAQDIKPGYYWTSGIKNVSIVSEVVDLKELSSIQPFLCGAYTADKKKYFDYCVIHKSSLCHISNYTHQHTNFDKSCFIYNSAASTAKPVNIGTSTTKNAVTVSRPTSINGRKAMKWKENDANLGVSVGVPVGLGVAVLCGILLGLYLMRRYRCWKTRSRPNGFKEEVSQENLPSPKPENVSVNKSFEINFVRFLKGKKKSDKRKQKGDQSLQNYNPEYAVVRKKNHKTLSQGQNKNPSSDEKIQDRVQDSVCDENISYCYARTGHKMGVDLCVNSIANQKSDYIFAVEKAGDTENNDEGQPNTGEEDYDVTFNVKHFNTDDNTYNTLQMEEYGSSHNQRRGDNTYNILNIPNDQDPENDYDTANQRNHKVCTISLYNRLC